METERKRFLLDKIYYSKRKCLEMCVNAGMGHVTSAFSCAEIVNVLFYEIMRYEGPERKANEDHFIMSKNHASVITYPIFADLGWLPEDELMTFLKNGSRLGAHSKRSVPGVEFAGGSLGMGLGVAAGLAYGLRLAGDTGNTFVIVGDGECYEGSIWESVMFAGFQKLDNLVAIIDKNRLAMTDFTKHMLDLESVHSKWEAFRWEVAEVDGHDIEQLIEVLQWARGYSGKPVCIIANTEKGHGIPFMCDDPFQHGVAPRGKDVERAFEALRQEHIRLLGGVSV